MKSRGLLRRVAAPCKFASGYTAPCLRSQPSLRLASAVQSNSIRRHYGLYDQTRSSQWPAHLTPPATPTPALRLTHTRPFTSRSSTIKPPLSQRRRRLYQLAGLALALHITYLLYNSLTSDSNNNHPRATLNKSLFTPCTVLANEPISPSAFLLTIQLPPGRNNDSIVAAAHAHGLWSVEVKQPQLQIARNYTPLPPPPADGDQQQQQQQLQLQFYVRRYTGGEVSSYLSRLAHGDQIEIRGPHLGFDLAQRVGAGEKTTTRRKVVFLAGGTGVAPALQAAAVLLRQADDVAVDVDVLWANRGGADCAGCARVGAGSSARGWWWWPGSKATEGKGKESAVAEAEPSAVVKQLRALQDAYAARGRTLDVRCAVDAEGRFFGPRDIEDAVVRGVSTPTPSSGGEVLVPASSASCHFHSQRLLEYCTDESDAAATGDAKTESAKPAEAATGKPKKCTCVGDGDRGKNLFIVSGPDGFVSAFAGPKVWADGGERQGPVGGLVAELRRKDPETWKNWLVLKQ